MSRPNATFLPAHLAHDSIESLHAQHGRAHLWTYWIVLAIVTVSLAALPLVRVDVTVRAVGMIRPAIERNELHAPFGGLIAEVRAQDNELVRRGNTLLVLASPALDEKIASNAARSHENNAQIDDLTRLLRHATDSAGALAPTRFGSSPVVASALPEVLSPRLSELPPEAFASLARRQEYIQLLTQLDGLDLKLARARRDLDRNAPLYAKGLVTDRDIDDARFAVDTTAAEAMLLLRQTTARWQSDLADRVAQRDALTTEARQLAEDKDLHSIRAPSDGALSGFTGLAVGGYVQPGQSLGALSPDETLRAECFVSPRDIGFIRVGQPTRLEIDAFPQTQWGALDGVVSSVSADYVVNGGQSAGFRTVVTLPRNYLTLANGTRGNLRKGMTTVARFLVTRRSLLSLLYQDVSDWLRP